MHLSSQFAPINEQEKTQRVWRRLLTLVSSVFFGLITVSILLLVFIDYKISYIPTFIWELYIIIFIGWNILFVITWSMISKYRKLSKDMKEGRKQIVVAPIDATRTDKHRRRRELPNGIVIRGKNSYSHYAWINGKKVRLLEYAGFEEGDLAEIHIAPRSKVLLGNLVNRPDLPPIEFQRATAPTIGN